METDTLNTYSVKIDQFEGPFSVLLAMIEERKLFINDISLSSITEDYIRYVNTHDIPPGLISNFVLVASMLILIKSKSLLPTLNLTNEEEGDIKNLEERLKLFEIYSNLSVHIKNNFGKRIIFAPEERKHNNVVFLPDAQITQESMMTFASTLLNKIPKKNLIPQVEIKKVISIEEMIDKLKDRIESSLSMNFREFSGVGRTVTREEKVTMIVGFLAMLELVREGILHVIQDNNFEDITIEKNNIALDDEENENPEEMNGEDDML
ncbi:MAG: segregation/condensation protein A [Candidatus Paceibacterota bacterium]